MRYLLIVVSFILLSNNAKAQNWYPSGASWTYEYAYDPFLPILYLEYFPVKYEAVKDTVIKSKPCRLVTRYWRNTLADTIYFYDSAGYVFYYPPLAIGDSVEDDWSLLYNFNADVGDTIYYPNMRRFNSLDSSEIIFYNVVYSVDTIVVNGDSLRTYSAGGHGFCAGCVFAWKGIEKMAPLVEYIADVVDLYPTKLRCYEDSVLGFYQNPNFTLSCDTSYIINASLSGLDKKTINIFPNPSNGIINIDLGSDFELGAELRIVNSTGEVIFTKTLNSASNKIDLSDQISGIYFYEIQLRERIFRDKLILQN